jgi:hypothetical protein
MEIKLCQQEMRFNFLGGFAGQLVSGLIWLAAAVVSLWGQPRYGMAVLFFGCMFIFPLTRVVLRLMRCPARVSAQNGLWGLGSQIAFTVPINFLLVGAATLNNENWFFPAAMIVVGAHYLPFVTLYGMRIYAALGATLVSVGAGLVLFVPGIFSLGGWFTASVLIVFAFLGRKIVLREMAVMRLESSK